MLPRRSPIVIAVPAHILLVSQTRAVSTGDNIEDFGRASFVFGFVLKSIDFGILTRQGEAYKIKKAKPAKYNRGPSRRRFWSYRRSANGELPELISSAMSCTILRILGSYLAWDIRKHAMGSFSHVQSPNRGSFFDEPLSNQVILTWLHQLEAFCSINLQYQVGALHTVATGIQTSSGWSLRFANLSDGYLISRAWGRVWHQLLRRPLGMLIPHAQRWLGVMSRSTKRTVSLICSFMMSGFVHWSGALNYPWTPSSHGMFTYFIMQALVVRMENLIMNWGKRKSTKDSNLLKCFGYMWTISWISFSMRCAARYQFEHGALSDHNPFKNSLVNTLVLF
ncbi:hypothetical protein BKA65DRAFT_563805 [Rhexocercosporidium sp. MPI-PUGE-AT-0058]|nr:hypothetical protein BKA65DRAFT_563805 [Rhexocercosporidium sp. MPI-PUGE-AT-0058]